MDNFEILSAHVGHKIVCVMYGETQNVAIECEDCHEVLLDYEKEFNEYEFYKKLNERRNSQ